MKAAYYTNYGPASAVECGPRPKPALKGPFDVLVEIKAAVLNPADVKIRAGNIKTFMPVPLPCITGMDFAGVVVEKGDQASKFSVGDEVFGTLEPGGACAEFLVFDARKTAVAHKPKSLSFKEAAALGMGAGTAWVGLIVNAGIKAPATDKPPVLLVIGASGGCGHFAVQFAKHFACQVIAVCSGRNAGWVKELGASTVIDYTAGAVPALLQDAGVQHGSVDVILDFVGGDDYYNSTTSFLKHTGTYVSAVGPIEHAGSTPFTVGAAVGFGGKVLWRVLTSFGKAKYSLVGSSGNAEYYAEIAKLAEQGAVKPRIAAEYSLEQVGEAHALLETHSTGGRILVNVAA